MSRYPVTSYIPQKVDEVFDLHTRLNEIKYNEILNDLDGHFQNCYVTNFDLIHNECRGDKLKNSRKYYETVFEKKLKENLSTENAIKFCSSGIKSERKDLFFEKKVYENHFRNINKLEKRGIFLSSMRKRFYSTENCKLKF